MTTTDLFKYAGDVIATASVTLAFYRWRIEPALHELIPPDECGWQITFWKWHNRIVAAWETFAVNSDSKRTKEAREFAQTAQKVLPDATIDRIKEKAVEEKTISR